MSGQKKNEIRLEALKEIKDIANKLADEFKRLPPEVKKRMVESMQEKIKSTQNRLNGEL